MGRLDRVESLFAQRGWARGEAFADSATRARERALAALAGWRGEPLEEQAVQLAFAADLLAAAAGELAARPEQAAALVSELQRAAGLSRMALAREALRSPALSAHPPARAVAETLGLVLALAPAHSASLWAVQETGRVGCLQHAGPGGPSPGARRLARRLIAGEDTPAGARSELFGLRIERSGEALGAIVARAQPRARERARACVAQALATLAEIIERDALLSRNAADERALMQASERRLARLGFDLHDGPLQELLLLGEDLRLFRDQLGQVLGAGGDGRLLRGRLDDLDARLVALEGGLRRISTSVHASVLVNRPFAAALGDLVSAFSARTGIEPEVRLQGDAEALTASQRIALLSVVGEALNNVREHSRARRVSIELSLGAAGVHATVVDDGCGFDVESALVRAARRGRIGLAGIHERVRLLGGRCVVDSRPGGPTAISLDLPRFEPLRGGSQTSGSGSGVRAA